VACCMLCCLHASSPASTPRLCGHLPECHHVDCSSGTAQPCCALHGHVHVLAWWLRTHGNQSCPHSNNLTDFVLPGGVITYISACGSQGVTRQPCLIVLSASTHTLCRQQPAAGSMTA
jgi:hypothetical protein